MSKAYRRCGPDPRTDDEKVDALVDVIARHTAARNWIVGQYALARCAKMSQHNVVRLMPIVVQRSGERYPGYRVIINNDEDTYKIVNRLIVSDLRTIAGRVSAGATKTRRAVHELDVKYARPGEVLVARQLAAMSEMASAVCDFMDTMMDTPNRESIKEPIGIQSELIDL